MANLEVRVMGPEQVLHGEFQDVTHALVAPFVVALDCWEAGNVQAGAALLADFAHNRFEPRE